MSASIKLWAAVICHRHGHDVFVARDRDELFGLVYNYVCSWWEREHLEGKPPEDALEAIDRYFAAVEDESMTVSEHEIEGD